MKSGFFLIWFLWLIDFCVYNSTEVWLKAFWQQEYYEIPSCVDSLVLNNIWTHTETMLSIKAPIVPLFPIQLLTFPNIVGTWLPLSLKLFFCMDVRMNNTKVLYKVRPTDRVWKYHEPKAMHKNALRWPSKISVACAELKYLPRGSLCKASEQMLTFHYFSGFQQATLANRLRQGPEMNFPTPSGSAQSHARKGAQEASGQSKEFMVFSSVTKNILLVPSPSCLTPLLNRRQRRRQKAHCRLGNAGPDCFSQCYWAVCARGSSLFSGAVFLSWITNLSAQLWSWTLCRVRRHAAQSQSHSPSALSHLQMYQSWMPLGEISINFSEKEKKLGIQHHVLRNCEQNQGCREKSNRRWLGRWLSFI